MSEELNNLIDDILKEKLKLHYENEELEAQGKLIKELCKENERLNNIIKEVRDLVNKEEFTMKQKYEMREELLEIFDKVSNNENN